ncbi:MAG: hypothetical protein NT154_43390 [Verrucomicrobia bacterium]|nr:hypothetical protein [Verrucomicrobiota bacterium]
MNGVKILLKHTETKRYLGRGGTWTDKPEAALAFLDEVRAKDHRIYNRLAHTQVVVLAETDVAKTPPTKTVIVKKTAIQEVPIVKTRKNQSQIPKQAKTKESPLKSTEETLIADQEPVAAGKQAASTPRSIEGQSGEALLPTEQTTIIQATTDVGFGNSLFIRGQGDGLSWDKGLPLSCVDGSAWVWSTKKAKGKVVFKLLLNDQVWAKGEDVVVEAGRKIEIVPVF